jgi:hypothetical protein
VPGTGDRHETSELLEPDSVGERHDHEQKLL